MQDRYTTKEIAQELNIADSTARQWARDYSISYRKSKGNTIFDKEALNIFKIIKQLKESGRSSDTIRHNLEPKITQLNHDDFELRNSSDKTIVSFNHELDTPQSQLNHAANIDEIRSLVCETVHQIMENYLIEKTDLTEKHALMAFEKGKLVTQRDILLDEVNRLNEQVEVLPTLEKVEQLKHQLAIAQATMTQLQDELEQERSKNWFKKLLGL